jgi:RNA methyltransferase, TrmH family
MMMDPDLVQLDGFHAVKHALRFGAELLEVVAVADSDWPRLAAELAPDVIDELAARVRPVAEAEFRVVSPQRHPTGIAAIARRPRYAVAPEHDAHRRAPAVLLENPRRLGNVGAVVRVAAAAGASGVAVFGEVDPWQAAAVRGSAGLHFALPVTRVLDLNDLVGPLVVMDPEGEPIDSVTLDPAALLVFGTEREGVSHQLKQRAVQLLALPMRAGVSSLNLATSVAATLYYWRLSSSMSERSSGS